MYLQSTSVYKDLQGLIEIKNWNCSQYKIRRTEQTTDSNSKFKIIGIKNPFQRIMKTAFMNFIEIKCNKTERKRKINTKKGEDYEKNQH